tara:strand:- start:285 stop:764 length:480 start_codon:yes stop_codon:yes gene_type:complete
MAIDPHDWAREVFERHDRRAEALENASIEAGNLALKALLILNGGASIAVLGFLSSVYSSELDFTEKANAMLPFVSALQKFAIGAGLAVFASAIAYLANSFYARALMDYGRSFEWPYLSEGEESKSNWKWGVRFNNVVIVAALGSIAMFVWGVVSVGLIY